MQVIKLQRDDNSEPVWDSVGIDGCDFRPHFDGDLHNLFTTIYPLESRISTESQFKAIAFEIANWILQQQSRFSKGDRFQIIVGWPKDVRAFGRQVIKIGGAYPDIQRFVDDQSLIDVREGWGTGIFECESAG